MKVVFNKASGHAGAKRLCDLRSGEFGKVLAVDCEGTSRGRLLELGLLPGTRLQYLRKAPFGDPLVVELRGYALSLGQCDARNILVAPEAEDPPG